MRIVKRPSHNCPAVPMAPDETFHGRPWDNPACARHLCLLSFLLDSLSLQQYDAKRVRSQSVRPTSRLCRFSDTIWRTFSFSTFHYDSHLSRNCIPPSSPVTKSK